MNNIIRHFFEMAELQPKAIAIIFGDHQVTYEELKDRVIQRANFFSRKGLKKGDRVLLFVPMSIQLYETMLALFYSGIVVVFVDQWSSLRRLRKAMHVVPVKAVIAKPQHIWIAYLLPPFTSIDLKIAASNKREKQSEFVPPQINYNDSALITFTTGSTGLPKAANRTHGFLHEQFMVLNEELNFRKGEICLSTLPIVLLALLGAGSTAIIFNFNQKKINRLHPDDQARFIENNKVELIVSSPFFIDNLLKTNRLVQLRKIITGGAPVFPDLAQKLISKFPSTQITVAYGSTEAEPISLVDAAQIAKQTNLSDKGLLVGKVHSSTELKIISYSTDAIDISDSNWSHLIPETSWGEIIVAGKHVLKEYFNSEDAFRMNKIVDEEKVWHRTGDAGRIIDGNLYLLGRCAQMIFHSGVYLSPFVWEYKLSSLKNVQKGTLLIENNELLVVLESKHPQQAVQELNKIELKYDKVKFVSTIPMDPRHHGKIDYNSLRKLL